MCPFDATRALSCLYRFWMKADFRFSAMIPVNAAVVSIKEGAVMIPITYTLEFSFESFKN